MDNMCLLIRRADRGVIQEGNLILSKKKRKKTVTIFQDLGKVVRICLGGFPRSLENLRCRDGKQKKKKNKLKRKNWHI